ncbi:MAG: hypothetical protein K5660_08270 [Paludibacteraceae bacterium]|nr:hypothetical protein [Paludibacteraceae bacterium]
MKQKIFTLLLAFIAAISFAGATDIASGSFKSGGTSLENVQGDKGQRRHDSSGVGCQDQQAGSGFSEIL